MPASYPYLCVTLSSTNQSETGNTTGIQIYLANCTQSDSNDNINNQDWVFESLMDYLPS